jgi:hypothetical protein
MSTRLFSFRGGNTGHWRVADMETRAGAPLPAASRLEIASSAEAPSDPPASWVLRGITSNERYVERGERTEIVAQQLELGRPETTRAALIAIRKNDAWWALTQDERLNIFKAKSHHGSTTAAISRTMSHSISSPGLSTPRMRRKRSTGWWPGCAPSRSGSMLSGKWISGSCVMRPIR